MRNKHYYQGNLPHWQPPKGTYFITYRLHGSIPKKVIQQLKDNYQLALANVEKEHALPSEKAFNLLPPDTQQQLASVLKKKKYNERKRYFMHFDDFLDSNLNEPHWLKNPEIAKLVADSFHRGADKHYKLWAYTIMSNHVHLLLTMLSGSPILWKVLQDSKKYTGRMANRVLGRTGNKFWERESYDHLVRDGKLNEPGEFGRIMWYVLNNPVKAGVVKEWKEWPYTYLHPQLQ